MKITESMRKMCPHLLYQDSGLITRDILKGFDWTSQA